MRRIDRWAPLAAALILCVAAGSATKPAAAGVLDGGCGQQVFQPFLPWLDPGAYFLVAGGDFETGAAGWTLAGARVSSGNEPWHVAGAGTNALTLPAGARAASPSACIGLLNPTLRFFARGTGGLLGLGRLEVDADVTVAGLTTTLPVGVVTGSGSYAPTLPLPLLANLTTPLAGGSGSVTLRFHALLGNWQVDDVYIDPFKTS
jgi:hypothetical protein